MEKYAWKGKIVDGKIQEYIKRHDEIWPEMIEEFKKAGIFNYTIWNSGNDLFGYYECDSIEFASEIQANSPVVKKWDEYMSDILIMEKDQNTKAQPLLKQVFSLD